jgi:F-type H+-transporting ATPase subunit a
MNTSSENTAVETNVAATTAVPETNAAHTEPVSGEAVHETSTFAPPTIYSETIGHIGSFEIRNSLIMSWLTVLFFVFIAWKLKKTKYSLVPGKFQNFIELVVESIFNFFESVVQNTKQTKIFFGLCATILLYVAFSNWFGLLPGVGSIGFYEQHEGHTILVPLFRSAYSDVNMTMAIAIISVFMSQVIGIGQLGTFHYLGKFFVNPLKDPIGSFVGLLELVSEFAKIISFTFRLYGNVFAGEVLLAVIGFLLPFIAPLPFYGLELFVGLVQGLVFCLLTLVFLKMAATPHGDHEEHGHSSHQPQSIS